MPRLFAALLFSVVLLGGCAELVTDILEYGSVVVEARRRSGEPVPGASLFLFTGARITSMGSTGPDGDFLFEHLPPDAYGVYAEPPTGYLRPEEVLGGPSTATIDEGLELVEGERKTARFTYLKIGPGALRVEVREPDGAPISGIPVTVYEPTGPLEEGTSDGSGVVLFDPVPFGAWGVALYPPEGYLEAGIVPPFQDGILIEQGIEEVVSLTFEPCGGTLEARVSDALGMPIQGYPVQLYDVDSVLVRVKTGSEGVATFGPLLCRGYGLRLGRLPPWVVEEGRGNGFQDGISVFRGSFQQFSFAVSRCAATIRVEVKDPAENPIPGAGLDFYTSDGILSQGTTDSSGSYTFPDAGCGVGYGVLVRPPVGYTVQEGRGFSFFDGIFLQEGEETSVTFHLTPG